MSGTVDIFVRVMDHYGLAVKLAAEDVALLRGETRSFIHCECGAALVDSKLIRWKHWCHSCGNLYVIRTSGPFVGEDA